MPRLTIPLLRMRYSWITVLSCFIGAAFCVISVEGTQTTSAAVEKKTKYPEEVYRLFQSKLQSRRLEVNEGVWSEWTPWTPCSRSCGGGIASQERQCLRTRRKRRTLSELSRSRRYDDKHADPALNAIENHRVGCVGLYKRFHLCNEQDCPAGSRDFRTLQCESYNGKHFMGKYYTWEPHIDNDRPCELNCRALGFRFYALLNKTVVDGTRCYANDPTKVCVTGVCKHVGCDGIVGSDKVVDACGVCGGQNLTCQIISGIFTHPQLPPGYNLIAKLPKGACNVNITELKPSRNNLALRRTSDGTYIINGNRSNSWSGEYPAAGTSFTYRRQEGQTPQYITTRGPLAESVDLLVVALHPNPGIKYEYMVPAGQNTAPPSVPDLGRRPALPPPPHHQPDFDYARNQETPSAPVSPYIPASAGASSPPVPGYGSGPSFPNPNHNPGHQGPLLSLGADGGVAKTLDFIANNPDSSRRPAIIPATNPNYAGGNILVNDGSSIGSHPGRHPGSNHRRFQGDKDPDVQRTDTQTGAKHVDQSEHGNGRRRHRNGKQFVWKQIGFTECTKSCGGGTQMTIVACVKEPKEHQVQVPDHRCKEAKPPVETVRCNIKPCPAVWVPGDWSACSASCGEGIQTREIACKQEISSALTMKVQDAACLTPPPPTTRPCQGTFCARWQAGDWGKCSTDCGKGMRHRKVQCVSGDGSELNESDCPPALKPASSEVCDRGSCSVRDWFTTEWTTHCSAECGTGVQTRKVHCSGGTEDVCDISKKPDSSRPCSSNKDCGSKWFTGAYSPCSATCDEGTQVREVVCLTFVRGQYRVGLDMQCPSKDKPETKKSCNLGPCLPQWYMTEWSECSQSCGTGVQRREVKCLDSHQNPSQNCREEDKPASRHACNIHKCPEVSEGSGVEEVKKQPKQKATTLDTSGTNISLSDATPPDTSPAPRRSSKGSRPKITLEKDDGVSPSSNSGECEDKFRNCHLVVQARLCKYKYYRSSCCASCSKKT